MRYFIAHLLRGTIAEYHRALVYDVAARFDLKISAGYFPSHISLKEPFEIDDVSVIRNKIKESAAAHHASPFTIRGFGHFDNQVIFLDVILSKEILHTVRGLQNAVGEIPEIPWGEYEPLKNFHLTVAKNDITKKFDEVWKYLTEMNAPKFDLLFDNVALFLSKDDKWVVDSVYPLNL